MHRRAAKDTPSYVADAVASAQINGRRLTASGGLFVVLLVAMSQIEAPIPRSGGNVLTPEDAQNTLPVGSPSARGSVITPVAQVGAQSSSKTPAAGVPWCMPSWVHDMITWVPGTAVHRPAA
jgi:hypothetical protein